MTTDRDKNTPLWFIYGKSESFWSLIYKNGLHTGGNDNVVITDVLKWEDVAIVCVSVLCTWACCRIACACASCGDTTGPFWESPPYWNW